MGAEKSETTQGDTAPRRALIGAYLGAAALGYLLGVKGALPFPEASTPIARVGFALREQSPEASGEAWAALASDVLQVRRAWASPDPPVLELVLALRGLASGGHPEWSKAEDLCKSLKWSRCDRAALEELARRSRP